MVKLTVRDRESIQEAVRRFRKLVERSGIKKEMRRREFFEKPSETKRRARLRAERRMKRNIERAAAAGQAGEARGRLRRRRDEPREGAVAAKEERERGRQHMSHDRDTQLGPNNARLVRYVSSVPMAVLLW